MRGFIDKLLLWITVMVISLFLIFSAIWAYGEEGTSCESRVHTAIQKLQPWYYQSRDPITLSRRGEHLTDLTNAICTASSENNIDPILAVAIAFRESSLLPVVGRGEKNGERGERGYFQVMPGGPAERFSPGECSQHVPDCNAKTAMRFMDFLRARCDNTWSWVGSYGRGIDCPSIEEAREWTEVKVARSYLCRIGDCDEIWPE